MAQLTQYIKSGSRMPGAENTVERVVIGLPGTPTELIIYRGKIYVYDSLGQTLIDGGYISANAFEAASVIASKLTSSSRKFINKIQFTATDYNTCSWDAGSIIFADGTIESVYSGNTGNITATTYIYYDGTSTIKTTTSYSTAISTSNIPLAIATPVGSSDGECVITPFISVGTTIDGDKITTGKISSVDTKTYFDLSNNRLQMSDESNTRVVIGKMSNGSYGIKASLPGYEADEDTNVNNYAIWATSDDSVDNVLIKEKTRGSVVVPFWDSYTIAHGLPYVPFVLVFVEETSGKYVKCFGYPLDDRGVWFDMSTTNIELHNTTDGDKTFKYYIFYDRVTYGTYETIYVHENSSVTEAVTL